MIPLLLLDQRECSAEDVWCEPDISVCEKEPLTSRVLIRYTERVRLTQPAFRELGEVNDELAKMKENREKEARERFEALVNKARKMKK